MRSRGCTLGHPNSVPHRDAMAVDNGAISSDGRAEAQDCEKSMGEHVLEQSRREARDEQT